MNKVFLLAVLVATAVFTQGCGSDDKMSASEEAQMKDGFKKGLDVSKMTPEQKKQMEKYTGGAGTAPSAPQGGSTGQ
jgi:ABC-type phosphate/phosphonate transport system substrate-binding protein